MSALMILAIGSVMVATAFLSGIFGMAGGLILIGILLVLLPLPDAMALHAITQMASNGWRALLWWRHVRLSIVVVYLAGCALALGAWGLTQYVPSTPVALLMLGATPFLVRVLPKNLKPNPESAPQAVIYGVFCTTLMLLTGVSGPLFDSFFLGGTLDRREIVATKSACQLFGHAMKLVYFTALIGQSASVNPLIAAIAIAASMLGTSLARPVLEMLTDQQYRRWATRMVTGIAGYYLMHGSYLLLLPFF
ncbi:MAG TPA: TSUP family transporter [Xanthobacteraceae bacterium]|nr:TSUP family transporter [Xanthobacteraceae bacterium]